MLLSFFSREIKLFLFSLSSWLALLDSGTEARKLKTGSYRLFLKDILFRDMLKRLCYDISWLLRIWWVGFNFSVVFLCAFPDAILEAEEDERLANLKDVGLPLSISML